jgi:hypothetical protein
MLPLEYVMNQQEYQYMLLWNFGKAIRSTAIVLLQTITPHYKDIKSWAKQFTMICMRFLNT